MATITLHLHPQASNRGGFVQFSAAYLQAFAGTWPLSGMRDARKPLGFAMDGAGNLCEIHGERKYYDPSAVLALSETARDLLLAAYKHAPTGD